MAHSIDLSDNRINDMVGHKELIHLLVKRARVIAWHYDAKTDFLVYWLPQEPACAQVSSMKDSESSQEWSFLWEGSVTGSVDVHAPGCKTGALFRLTFLRLEHGQGVIGIAEELSAKTPGPLFRLQGGVSEKNVLVERIEDELMLLHEREKGVLFAMEIGGVGKDNRTDLKQKEKCLGVLEKTIHDEFRDTDIIGILSETRVIVFFHGELSIDVVEHRAQRFLDDFSRRAMDLSLPLSCSIGISVTAGGQLAATNLIATAEKVLNEAIDRGANHYRMFESDKY